MGVWCGHDDARRFVHWPPLHSRWPVVFGVSPMARAASAVSRAQESDAAGGLDAAGTGGVAINGSSTATANPTVTVTIPAPSNGFGTVRLSNDGGATWLERPWTTSRDVVAHRSRRGRRRRRRNEDRSRVAGRRRPRHLERHRQRVDPSRSNRPVDRRAGHLQPGAGRHVGRLRCDRRRRRPGSNRDLARRRPLADAEPEPVQLLQRSGRGPARRHDRRILGAGPCTTCTRERSTSSGISPSPPRRTPLAPTSMRMGDDLPANFEFPLPAVAGRAVHDQARVRCRIQHPGWAVLPVAPHLGLCRMCVSRPAMTRPMAR